MNARRPRLVLVVAVAANGVIGREGGLPWRLSADLRRFKHITLGKPVVMGRKTWESIGKPLPGRHNIVVTRRRDFHVEDAAVTVVHDLDGALAAAGDVEEVMIIGGAEIYALSLPRAKIVELTRVHADIAGDTRLPEFSAADWQEIARSEHPADERNDYPMSFITLQRR
ncbi:MAG: dihydrofolate reductase [Gammaproteobacteria bacterium]|nr:dihydrofolate reductase [Gammaproteobacteria bacterium]